MTFFEATLHQPLFSFPQRLDYKTVGEFTVAPAAASVHVALTMLVSAWASRYAMRLQEVVGVAWGLLAAMLLQGAIILSMAVVLHPLVVILLLLRSTPRALMLPIINATIHPRLYSGIRATFLSLQSFAGRLLFGAALLTTSIFTSGMSTLTAESLSNIIMAYALLLAGVLIVLSAGSGVVTRVTQSTKME